MMRRNATLEPKPDTGLPAALETLLPMALRKSLIALRRELHRHPELSFAEERTALSLEAALAAIPAASIDRVVGTGLVARIRGRDSRAPVVAVRGDIDALPI